MVAMVRFNHLGLPVRDYQRSLRFYTAYFGFDPATAQEYPTGTGLRCTGSRSSWEAPESWLSSTTPP
jgi:catechol 2,3-dioxygenase-like lactoylglutathione lyase family enzyme